MTAYTWSMSLCATGLCFDCPACHDDGYLSFQHDKIHQSSFSIYSKCWEKEWDPFLLTQASVSIILDGFCEVVSIHRLLIINKTQMCFSKIGIFPCTYNCFEPSCNGENTLKVGSKTIHNLQRYSTFVETFSFHCLIYCIL